MKSRLITISILLLAICFSASAQSRHNSSYRPKSHHTYRKPTSHTHQPIRHRISSTEIRRLQDYYWLRFRIKISRSEAERILIAERISKGVFHLPPPPPPSPYRR